MLIGLTYDLREDYLRDGYGLEETAEFDSEVTIAGIESALQGMGHRVERIGRCTDLVHRLSNGERWDLVFNIAEGMHGIGREAQVPALLDAHAIPYTFSDPLVLAVSLHKGITKRIVRDLCVPTPDFVVVNNERDIDEALATLAFPLFAKPVAEGTSKGVTALSKITSAQQLRDVCRSLLAQFRQPVLVERFLPGREFTVGIVGTGDDAEVIGVMEVLLFGDADRDAYTFDNKEDWEGRCRYTLVDGPIAKEAGDLALKVWRGLGARDAGRIDVRANEHGRIEFIEINPLAGLNPEKSDLPILCGLAGRNYQWLIERIVQSAMTRIESKVVQRSAARRG